MRTFSFAVAVTMLLSSLAASAADIHFDLQTLGDSKTKTAGVAIDIPVIETGDESFPIDWDATIGFIASQSRDGSFHEVVKQDGETEVRAVNDGNAGYIVLGVQGRKTILTKYIEAVVKAEYAAQVHKSGSLEDFNPNGGLNLAAGANLILGDKKKFILGARINRNIENKATSVRIVLGGRF